MRQAEGRPEVAHRQAVTAMAANALVRDVAEKLSEPGIEVMPIKGALLQHWLYDDPAERRMSDVDLLVRPDHLALAAEVLEGHGYHQFARSSIGAAVFGTRFGLALDLHDRLFDKARYRMSTYDVFARSARDQQLYGAKVWIPSEPDVFAHLIGKFASDHLDDKAVARLDEIARMAARITERPEVVAKHLTHCGMRRAARYVLPLVHQASGELFCSAVCEYLPPDTLGRGLAALARPTFSRVSRHSRAGAVMAHLLNDSVPRGLRSGFRAVVRRR